MGFTSHFSVVAAAAAAFMLTSTPAVANVDWEEDAVILEPSSDWSLREYDDKCRMRRTFGNGDNRSTLWLDRGGIKPVFNITAIGRPFRNPFGANLIVQFAPEERYIRNYLTASSSRGRPSVILFGARLTPTHAEIAEMRRYDGEEEETSRGEEEIVAEGVINFQDRADVTSPERIAAITELRMARALLDPVVLRIGPLTEPMAQLEACAERLLIKIAQNGEGGTPAIPTETARWAGILQQNYPLHMLRAEQEARIGVALNIGTNGKPTYCEVTEVVGLTSFNDTVCMLLLRHATFEPARNAQGEPVVGRYATRVTFKLN